MAHPQPTRAAGRRQRTASTHTARCLPPRPPPKPRSTRAEVLVAGHGRRRLGRLPTNPTRKATPTSRRSRSQPSTPAPADPPPTRAAGSTCLLVPRSHAPPDRHHPHRRPPAAGSAGTSASAFSRLVRTSTPRPSPAASGRLRQRFSALRVPRMADVRTVATSHGRRGRRKALLLDSSSISQ